jgi:DNA-binding MarR family transcriptional regulator
MDYEELAKELIRNMRAAKAASRHMPIQDENPGESIILYCIKKREWIVPSEISDAIGVSTARVATVLNGLEEKGLITREIDSGDRRRIIVKLTQKGAERAEEQHREHIENIKSILSSLGEEDAKELVRIFGKLAEVLSKVRL